MKYINAKTGAIIDVKSKIIGGNWQAVEPAKEPPKSTSTCKKKKVKECNNTQQ